MIATLQQLGIERMSVAERLELIGLIWDSIPSDPDSLPLSDAQRGDLDRRIADADAHPEAGIPWEVVKAQALSKLKPKCSP